MPTRRMPSHPDRRAIRSMRILPVIILAILSVAMMAACDEENKEVISGKTDPEKTPTMTTTDVSTLISDSGITRYKITTPLWLMYEEAQEPKWRFPDGLHLEKFDLRFKPEATVDCDSAIFYKSRQLWQLDGYVNIRNTLGEKFLTNQLFWNQRQQKIYSDSFIHIERDGKVIEGYGFESNEQMTRYHVLKVSGIFPADKFRQAVDSPVADSAAAPVAPPPAGTDPKVPHTIVKGEVDDSKIKKRITGENIKLSRPISISDKRPSGEVKKSSPLAR